MRYLSPLILTATLVGCSSNPPDNAVILKLLQEEADKINLRASTQIFKLNRSTTLVEMTIPGIEKSDCEHIDADKYPHEDIEPNTYGCEVAYEAEFVTRANNGETKHNSGVKEQSIFFVKRGGDWVILMGFEPFS